MIKFHPLALTCATLSLLAACGGGDGSNGAAGSKGHTMLMLTQSEPTGTHCPRGGKRIDSGLDTNDSGVLDALEVTNTQYVCDAIEGRPLPWVHVTATAAQTERDTGYLADNEEQVTLTLPVEPELGALLRVSGVGRGGWRIAQNAGQSIQTIELAGGAIGKEWAAQATDANKDWVSVASSADGIRLVAAQFGGDIFTSSDAGRSWQARKPIPGSAAGSWFPVASSADGTQLVAAEFGGKIFTSADAGEHWTQRQTDVADTKRNWWAVASSADGSKLVAIESPGHIHTSADYGASWTARATDAARVWNAAASSTDGSHLVAVANDGYVFTSDDSGATWKARQTDKLRSWLSVASSADGTRLVALEFPNRIHTSRDAGATWEEREAAANWSSVTMSGDGSRMAAVAFGGQIHTSTDFGATWALRDTPQGQWWSIGSSLDGTRLVAVGSTLPIYTSAPSVAASTSTGVGGGISARQYDSIDLQYVGNGKFVVQNSAGTFDIR